MAKGGKFAALATYRQNEAEPDVSPIAADPAGTSVEQETAASVDTVTAAEPAPAPEPESQLAHTTPTVITEPYTPPRAKAAPAPPRPRGRPPGKRSDPEWKLFSHFLKRSTQRQATAVLFEADDGRDLSDVLQTLLEKWVSAQRAKR